MWWVDIEVPNDSVDKSSWESSACYPRRTFDPLSESPSTRDSRITMADFRLCSTSRSHSQAGLYHYAHEQNLWNFHLFTGLGPCLPNNLSTYGARRFHISRSEWDRVFSRLTVVPGLSWFPIDEQEGKLKMTSTFNISIRCLQVLSLV